MSEEPIATILKRMGYIRYGGAWDFYSEALDPAFCCLHIVLGDGNIEDNHLKSCLEDAEANKCEACLRTGKVLLPLNEEQRKQIYEAIYADTPS